MISIIKVLQPKVLLPISSNFLSSFKGIRLSTTKNKLLTVVTTGSVIAGCCFSRQSSDEEKALISQNKNHTISQTGLENPTNFQTTETSSMKRNANETADTLERDESVGDIQNIEIETNLVDIGNVPQKKIKIDTSTFNNDSIDEFETYFTYKANYNRTFTNELLEQESDVLIDQSEKKTTVQSHIYVKDDERFTKKLKIENNETVITDANESNYSLKSVAKTKNLNRNKSGTDTRWDRTESSSVQNVYQREKPKKDKPNYFVAIQVLNDQIIQNLEEVQNYILEQEPRLEKSMTKLKTLHITLMVMSIKDQDTLARAEDTLRKIYQEYDDDLSKNPIQLKFQGLKHFGNRVLYAELIRDSSFYRLISLQENVEKHFQAASIFTTDRRRGFTPHLTVAKIDVKDRSRRGVNKINPLFYTEFLNEYFGSQRIEGIQLLSMTEPKTKTGYYSGYDLIFSAYNSTRQMDSLNKLLRVQQQKEDIKEKIRQILSENPK